MTDEHFHPGSRTLQDRFDTRRLADRAAELFFGDESPPIDEPSREFIERMEMVFVATAAPDGAPHCAYKGGAPGFVRVLDQHTLLIPNYDGNGIYGSWGNVLAGSGVHLLFIDFEAASPWRLGIDGSASIDFDDPLTSEYAEAQFVVRIRPTRIMPVCPRYVHQMEIVKRSRFVPTEAEPTPVAEWKLDADEVPPELLAADDPARAEAERRAAQPEEEPQPAPTHGPFPGR